MHIDHEFQIIKEVKILVIDLNKIDLKYIKKQEIFGNKHTKNDKQISRKTIINCFYHCHYWLFLFPMHAS